MKKLLVTLITAIVLISCGGQGQTVELTPFIGGTDGVVLTFSNDMRPEVFDGGQDPFDLTVQLQNKGETDVPKDKITVAISGILPQEFNKIPEDLAKHAQEDLPAKKKLTTGTIQESPIIYTEFLGLNHVSKISGSVIPFMIRADACYQYATKAVSKVCIRKNIQNPSPNGLCEIDGDKVSSASSGPIQIGNFKETTRGSNKIGFSFDVTHVGSGRVFERESSCADVIPKRDRIKVRVDSKIGGLTCTGLYNPVGTTVEGITSLFENKKQITCTQEIKSAGDYELPITVDVEYDYLESVTKEITIKTSNS